MKKGFIVLTIIFTLFIHIPLFVSAEASEENINNPLTLEELTIQVLPEYSFHPKDEKREGIPLLVGYHGSFMNVSDEPVKGVIEIPLPVHEKNFRLGFVADYSADLREMFEIEYVLDEELGVISWETSREINPNEMYKFVIEYYTDSISTSGITKDLDYEFTSFANIGLFNLIFVEPLKTDSFNLEPAAETHQKNTFNMNMFLYQVTNMKPGDEKEIHLQYEREDDRLTLEILEDMAGSAGQYQATTINEEKIPLWQIITVIGGVTIVLGGLLIFFIKKRSAKQTNSKKENSNSENLDTKKAKLRSMLLDGSITEDEYKEILKNLGGKK